MDGTITLEDTFNWDDAPTADTWLHCEQSDRAEAIGSITLVLEGASVPVVPVALPFGPAQRPPSDPPSSRGSYEGLPPSWALAAPLAPAEESDGTRGAMESDAQARDAEHAAADEAHAAADEALTAYSELRDVVNELKRIASALNAPAH